ncbi:MAG: imidazolonepropionase [Bacteroidales bacterium]|jgi:imidazolonepropionase|nr:imidazolonepropionase [Bacteroidales bacterium]MDD4058060.1 imidazolonepropionase [Bacteroidales bacterium]
MKRLFINIGILVQVETGDSVLKRAGEEMSVMNLIKDSYMAVENEVISDFGSMETLRALTSNGVEYWLENMADEVVDLKGAVVMPSFCDSHTHLVYAGSREREFIDKVRGLSYKEIAARGGGILNSAQLLHETDENELFRQTEVRAREILSYGTGAVEIKSGYGLNPEDEIKMLRVAKRIEKETPLTVKTTFLGAHAVPSRYLGKREEYVNEIINEMIPVIATEELADYVDVFTEDGFFTVEDTDRILNAGMKYGLRAKVHANQMSFSGGVQVGVKYNAISVDHLEFTGVEEFNILKNSDTMATLLPGSTFFLEMEYAPARRMIESGIAVALATNYNPGSSPYGDMRFIMALAALKYKMTTEEIINAVTINGAYAMGLSESHGSIARGKRADFIVCKDIPSLDYIPYTFTSPLIDQIWLGGVKISVS